MERLISLMEARACVSTEHILISITRGGGRQPPCEKFIKIEGYVFA